MFSFDTVDHDWLIRFVERQVGDQRVVRLIRKWLKAGVVENGTLTTTKTGTPQGSVISPLLSNIYLHNVFDIWAHQWRKRPGCGHMMIVRYADDVVCGFEHEADARAFHAELAARMETFALSLHPEKTRVLEFGRFAAEYRKRRGDGKPETFAFLGFTHICGQTRSGKFLLYRKSRRDRMRSKLQEIKGKLCEKMHESIPEQGHWLGAVVRGYFAYHAVPTNSRALGAFRYYVMHTWLRSLQRRSQRTHMTWEKMRRLAREWLPMPRITHPWPAARFAVKHPGWEPSARKMHARICAGGAR